MFLNIIGLSYSATACRYIGLRVKLKWKKSKQNFHTSNLFGKQKLQEKRTLLISYVMLCGLCLIKNQFPKINSSDKTGESGDGGWLVLLLVEIESGICPVGRVIFKTFRHRASSI